MIWESHAWKVDLMQRATWLRKRRTRRWWLLERHEWSEAECVKAEQCVMLGAYCIRKLREAGKLTDATKDQSVSVTTFKPTGKPVHSMNWHHLDKLYDLAHENTETRQLDFICNQLIHSYVFVLGFNEGGGLDHLLFCSDHERHKNLFRLSIEDLARAMETVAHDDVVESHMEWNEKRRDYDRTQQ
jgi:hypothetical protein